MYDNKFFENLYKGYAAESFITGQLFENGFESFRLPADFGIDLVVTNQFKKFKLNKSSNQKISDDLFPFGLQVKSRRLKQSQTLSGANGRPEYQFYYMLNNKEITTLKEFPNSAYVFVFFVPVGMSSETTYAFFINSNEINNMIEHEFFIKENDGYKFNVCFRAFPQQSRESVIEEMLSKKMIDEQGVKYLRKNLPEKFQKNWNASEGLYLCKNNFSAKMHIKNSYDFSEFPYFDKINYSLR